MPARKEATFLLDTDTLFKSVRNKLLESGKEPVVVVALCIIRPDPRGIDETGSKQVDVLDVQPAAAAREQIAAAVFEWQLGLHKTMLARFFPPIKISVEVPL